MSAATGDLPDPPTVHGAPQFGGFAQTGFTCSQGWHLMRDSTGLFLVATEAPGLLPGGFAERALRIAAVGSNTDLVNVRTGKRLVQMLAGDTFTAADGPRPIYAVNNQEFGRSPVSSAAAERSIAGLFICLDDELPLTRCVAIIGPEGVAMAQSLAAPSVAPTHRAVITTIAAYAGTLTGTLTASATGAIGAQDGVTLVAGDRVFLPLVTGGAGGATVAADSGPYLVVNPGATGVKFVLTRPPEYLHGALIPEALTIKIGEGTAWGMSEWRAFPATAALVIDTGDPAFWPRTQTYEYTIGTGFVANGGLGNAVFYLRHADRFASTNKTSAHANWASTITTGQGTGALVFTGTASDVMVGMAVNF